MDDQSKNFENHQNWRNTSYIEHARHEQYQNIMETFEITDNIEKYKIQSFRRRYNLWQF